jgi:hypothetical protein
MDSTVANLAGMISRPTWVLVNTSSDWRWGSQGTTARWMEGVTVLRHAHEGNWDSVVQDAARLLASQ